MTHTEALDSHAAERYVLGEMPEDEATAFEEHFFECGECGRSLDTTERFVDGLRLASTRVLRPRRPAGFRARLPVVIPWAAAAALAAVVLFQFTVTLPRLERAVGPRVFEPTILRVVRAEPPVVTLDRDEVSFQLIVDVTAPEPFPRYRLEFRSEGGDPVTTIETDALPTGTLFVSLPTASFPDGRYTMTLTGLSDATPPVERTLETYRFRIEESE